MHFANSFQNEAFFDSFFMNTNSFSMITPFFPQSQYLQSPMSQYSNIVTETGTFFDSADQEEVESPFSNLSLAQKAKDSSKLALNSKKISKNSESTKINKEVKTSKNTQRKVRDLWKPQEDEMLIQLVNSHGYKWTAISKLMKGRSDKQVRDRYINNLMPGIKNDKHWSLEEDQKLVALHHQYGKKWALIAKYMPGRSECKVKNRFYQFLKDRLDSEEFQKDLYLLDVHLVKGDSQSTNSCSECSEASPVNQNINENGGNGQFESFLFEFFRDEKLDDLYKLDGNLESSSEIKDLLTSEVKSPSTIPLMSFELEDENNFFQHIL